MKKHIKAIRIFSLLFTFLILSIMTVPLAVNADNKEYNVQSAYFTINLKKDGTMEVHERWQVEFVSGSFTRFYKDICSPSNQLEYIDPSDITVVDCKINGADAEPNSGERVDGHYFLDLSSSNPTINWYQSASNEVVTYEITYDIANAVKLNQDDDAMLSYRLIGENFSKPVGEVGTSVIISDTPDKSDVKISQGKTAVFDVEKTEGILAENNAQNVSGIYKVELTLDSSIFTGLKRIIDVTVPTSVTRSSKGSDLTDTLVGIIVSIVVICMTFGVPIAFVVKIITGISKTMAFKKAGPEQLKEITDEIEQYDLPFTYYTMRPFSNVSIIDLPRLMVVQILEMCRNGIIRIEDDGFSVLHSAQNLEKEEQLHELNSQFLSIMSKHITNDKQFESDYDFISFDDMRIAMNDDGKMIELYTDVKNWAKTYQNYMKKSEDLKTLNKNKEFRKVRKKLTRWIEYSHVLKMTSDPHDCLSVMKRQGSISLFAVMEYIIAQKCVSSATDVSNGLLGFSYDIVNSTFSKYSTAVYRTSVHNDIGSGSSCSSCSSCGGCGGCGGGGAD